MSSEKERKVFKTILFIGLMIIFLGLCFVILSQQGYIKLLEREIILKNGQTLPEEGNIQTPEENPEIFRDKNGEIIFILV